jgi:uncharacterized Rossmann fold enzyme
LDLNPDDDAQATSILDSILQETHPKPLLDVLRKRIENQVVIVCGAGPSLDKHLEKFRSSEMRDNAVFIAADGAASALKEFGYKCQIIVTDLDGNLEDILDLTNQGSIPIVHAHGDNIERMERVVPSFDAVVGSTQVQPTKHVFLWGGFTDGDRACYIASRYNPKRILMMGMDFGTVVGRWSKPGHVSDFPASERKQIKLEIAKELITHLKKSCSVDIEFFE